MYAKDDVEGQNLVWINVYNVGVGKRICVDGLDTSWQAHDQQGVKIAVAAMRTWKGGCINTGWREMRDDNREQV
jgi:hypothetical protein